MHGQLMDVTVVVTIGDTAWTPMYLTWSDITEADLISS